MIPLSGKDVGCASFPPKRYHQQPSSQGFKVCRSLWPSQLRPNSRAGLRFSAYSHKVQIANHHKNPLIWIVHVATHSVNSIGDCMPKGLLFQTIILLPYWPRSFGTLLSFGSCQPFQQSLPFTLLNKYSMPWEHIRNKFTSFLRNFECSAWSCSGVLLAIVFSNNTSMIQFFATLKDAQKEFRVESELALGCYV